ncbi:ADP-ribosylglycohydrolase family protein [Salinispora mooreana]|uniref:ADP-ribosylglycohydrolase family protein n=1 Tax=Salinispora mooreana TaxID=999545 RepID=UPI00047658CB|nr:ADP-ribosylglycohydrolase family protein [Salinispora mooreana]
MRVSTASQAASGCLFGLAYGDALGGPTEFMAVPDIHARYGPDGPRALAGDPAPVTDDTQLTLAVGMALLDAPTPTAEVLEPLLRERFVQWAASPDNNRAPGMTCLRACGNLALGQPWTQATMVSSKGCGANMRVAPVGLIASYDLDTLAGVAQLQAAMTHGHPTALVASELTAYAVRLLRDGVELPSLPTLLRARTHDQRTVYRDEWLGALWQQPGATSPTDYLARGWDECQHILDRLDLALASADDGADACRVTGAGWIAEEALATALFCAIRHADAPVSALARAATTSGDSDSIACLTGAFLGAAFGMAAWPESWRDHIEYTGELAAMGAAWD